MITVEQAEFILLRNVTDFGTQPVNLSQAVGRVLKEPLIADRDFPAFDRVTMDGIAIRHEAFTLGLKTFEVKGMAAAGDPVMALHHKEHCLEVMTGAVLPLGADCVIRYEDLDIQEGRAHVLVDNITCRQNIHAKGSDRKAGTRIISTGRLLSPAEIGVAATIGKENILVSRIPKVAIIATGDELVGIHETPLPHQIRSSNSYMLAAALKPYGVDPILLHIPDEKGEVLRRLGKVLEDFEVILLSGGVSEGKKDYIPSALQELGVRQFLHKIGQRPGKPFWFGGNAASFVFGLPGNPVSALACYCRYVVPWLKACMGVPALEQPWAMLQKSISFAPDLTYFAQVKITYTSDGRLSALPVEGKGSGDLANLADADGFIQLPKGKNFFNEGEVFPFYGYRP